MSKNILAFILLLSSSNVICSNLIEVRNGTDTVLTTIQKSQEVLEIPPSDIFNIVKYKTELGEMFAYLSKTNAVENKKIPAIVWLTGGFPTSSPGNYLWTDIDVKNEQAASIYRNHGIAMMFPTLRGGVKGNPGRVEQFYGEVNDVISAGLYLKSLDYIDPERVYLGGHSTGGTLALLVAESTDIFAGTISLGPTSDHYGKNRANYDWSDNEIRLRSPKNFLSFINNPTYIIEGEFGRASSIIDFQQRLKLEKNNNIKTALVSGANHFKAIHSINNIFAKAIIEGHQRFLSIDVKKEIEPAFNIYKRKEQETTDLRILSNLRSKGILIEGKKKVESSFYARDDKVLLSIMTKAKSNGLNSSQISTHKSTDGSVYFMTTLSKLIDVNSLINIFELSHTFNDIADENNLYYDFWYIRN